jgi:enoyl-CoA hydratase/carnithine racemase
MQAHPTALLYAGDTLRLQPLADGFVELRFDRSEGSVNMFDQRTVAELDEARRALEQLPWLRGILVTSAKDVFIVGADITEFTRVFAQPRPELVDYLRRNNEVFLRFEALPVPSVAAINGYALGGGLEFALVATHRVMAQGARIGVPEVGLGLIPGLGGTVRLPRIAGVAHALDWITDGEPRDAHEALRCGVVDRVCAPEDLRDEALALLHGGAAGWRQRREVKRQPVAMTPDALQALIAQRCAALAERVPAWLPAAAAATVLVGRSARMEAPSAQQAEAETFASLAKSQTATALVRNFINQQAVRRLARQLARSAPAEPACETGEAPVAYASPLPGATLVEIATTDRSDTAEIARLAAEASRAGKIAVRVRQDPDGVIRRVHAACLRACEPLLRAGIDAATIDAAMRDAGWDLGPFGAAALLRPGTVHLVRTSAARAQQVATDAIVQRLLLASIVEASCVLDERVVATAAEVDLALLLGLGFPRHLGGPLHHADWLGLDQVCALARELGETIPAPLQARAVRRETFYAAA